MENKPEQTKRETPKSGVWADGEISSVNIAGDAEELLRTLQQARKDLETVERQVSQLIEWQDRIYRDYTQDLDLKHA